MVRPAPVCLINSSAADDTKSQCALHVTVIDSHCQKGPPVPPLGSDRMSFADRAVPIRLLASPFFSTGVRLMGLRPSFHPKIESLEDRITPIINSIEFRTGVLLITPPVAQAVPHTIQINQQLAQITLPNSNVISGHGLKTAEAHTPVVEWTPT